MSVRLRYPELAPDGYAALSAFGHYVNTGTALEPVLLGLVYLRASVLNGCNFCIQLHKAELRKHHEPETRIAAVGDVPEADVFTPRELAALRWTDCITRLGHHGASDEDYAAVTRFFQDKELVDLTFAIANINAWNRMGVAFRPEWRGRTAHPAPTTVQQASPAPLVATSVATIAGPELQEDGGKVAED